ncbi:MAG: sulfur carrier protein ThiS [Gemmatimonadota bacterium]|nr:sulfur carrier protein ThiS [Gemmatimonadota bacterium]
MRIQVNGRDRQIEPGTTALGLLEALDLDPRSVVLERNREIVRRDALGDTPLGDGDRIEIVHFVGGG